MKRSLFVICLCALTLCALTAAHAGTYTFSPVPADMQDLEHSYYYSWRIKGWSVPIGDEIVAATLSIANLNDWTVEAGDILYIHLLDTPPTNGTKIGGTNGTCWRWSDNQGGGDNWASAGPLLTTYTDDDPWPNPSENWSYAFTPAQRTTLQTFAADGKFGFGFDPDCCYSNTGITLTVTTRPVLVPEPCSLVALLTGLAGLAVMRRRK